MKIGVIGFGEVGKIFATYFLSENHSVICWDLNFKAGDSIAEKELQFAKQLGNISIAQNILEIIQHSDLVFCAVTADQTKKVGQEISELLSSDKGIVYLDLNSASPHTKKECAAAINAKGSQYIEVAVMTSVPPYGAKVPMLLGGPYAQDSLKLTQSLGLNASFSSEQYGVASAIKMCRSVVIKGMEAIFVESLTAARAYGVENQVIASFQETFPTIDWERQATYFFERVVTHGKRRSEEMMESANTVSDVGIHSYMARACAERQAWQAQLAKKNNFPKKAQSWRDFADLTLHSIAQQET